MSGSRPTDAAPAHGRFAALDLLRGATVAAMIVVNNPGNWNSVYPQLTHSAWHGTTTADLIFPAFIFIMGVAMAFTLAPGRTGSRMSRVHRRVATRSILLVLLGLALNLAAAWPHPSDMRVPGVLQRIGITYLVAALITLRVSDARLWASAATLLLVHWGMLVLPLGLRGSGVLEPGNNVALSVDRALFGTHLLLPGGDPEGALGVLSSVATALVGAAVGRWLLRDATGNGADLQRTRGALARLTVAGVSAVLLGLLWSTILPLNKPLWTGSFAILSCGVAALLLVVFAALTTTRAAREFSPLLWLGTNPLAIYFLSELTSNMFQRPWLQIAGGPVAPKDWFYWNLLAPSLRDGGGRLSSLMYALLYTAAWIAVAGVMRWRGVRLRV